MTTPAALQRAAAEYEHARRTVTAETAALETTRADITAALAAQRILQDVAAGVQQSAHRQIAAIVSKCLQTVFGDSSYEFRVVFEAKRGKTEARLAFVRDGVERDPLSECGGGVIDCAAFGLRLAALVLQRPAKRRLLVLDEPAKMISREYAPRIKTMLEILAADLDLQIILVTHNPAMAAGRVIEIEP